MSTGRDVRVIIVLGLIMLLGNAAYAGSVPTILDAFGVPSMPHGYREATSPTADAGATFVDVTSATGIDYTRYSWEDGDLPYVAVIGGGVAAGDIDDDGRPDLYFPPGGPSHPARLYRNLGDWAFDDVTDAAGLAATGFGTGASFGDYDNDGDADLYVFVDEGGVLYANDGSGVFVDVTDDAGLLLDGLCGKRPCQGSSVVWFDHDLDGDLDLFLVNNVDWRDPRLHTSGQDYASLIYFASEQVSLMFDNNGDGTFTEITFETELDNDGGKGLGATTADFDGNGWPDVATANDITKNALYLNRGGGVFDNVAVRVGASEVKTSMGIQAGDLDGDGRPDLVLSNFRGDKMSLLLQTEDGTFDYRTEENGMGASWRGTGWGVTMFDYDLDGWLDVGEAVGRAVPLKPNELHNIVFSDLLPDREDQLYRNLGHGMFAEVTYNAGDLAGNTTTRAILAVDLDGDGDEDLVRVNVQGQHAEILRNDRANEHNSLQLDLEGTTSNRDAIGAKVEVRLPDGRTVVREHASSAGYQTGLPATMTIGLGHHDTARVTVHWPGSTSEYLGLLDAGRHHIIEAATTG